MNGITTHVLDTSRGSPAAGVQVTLAVRRDDGQWTDIASVPTDADGRAPNLLPENVRGAAGTYRLRFDVGDYFGAQKVTPFYPYVEIVFTVRDDGHYHVPLLISPFGYSTYRGS